MQMGDKNSVTTQQHWLDTTFEDMRDEVQAYIDDIFPIGGPDTTNYEHYKTLCKILDRLREQKLYVNRKKSILFVDDSETLNILGHEVGRGTYAPEAAKTDAFVALRSPTNFAELGTDLGKTGWVERFLPFANMEAAPLHQLLHKDRWEWTATHEASFNKLKDLMKNRVELHALVCAEGETIWVVTDGSLVGIGGFVCVGKTFETARPVLFYSCVLTPTQSNYPVHEIELLALVDMLETNYHLFAGREFTWLVDNRATTQLLTQKHLSPRQARWVVFLNQFQMTIEHIPGKQNAIADTLS
jgi:hypothetical protein